MWLCDKKKMLMNFLFCFLIEVTMAEDVSWLVYSSFNEPEKIIVRPFPKHGTSETHIPTLGYPTALTFDYQEKKIYWALLDPREIQRANIDGTSSEIIFDETSHDAKDISGLALDWITKNIYVAYRDAGEINVCDLRRKLCVVLVRDSTYAPYRVALHPQSGTMVWTNQGDTSAIFKASMDGSNPTQITAKDAFRYLGSIAIDHAFSRLYWIDEITKTIHTSDFDGGNMSTLKSIGNTSIQALGLAVTEKDIYWLDANEDSIKKCNKNDGSLFEVEKSGGFSDTSVSDFDMFVMGPGSQPNDRVNHCANHSCSHVCVITKTSYRCMCSDGLTLPKDGQHCDDAAPKMIISTSRGMYLLSTVTREMKTISNSIPTYGLSYDFANYKIYWAGGNNGSTIFRSDLNGSASESVVTISGGQIMGLAYDWIAHNIYYSNGRVGVCDSSGTNCAVLLRDYQNILDEIQLFPRLGLMFWNAFGRGYSINRAYMDGSSAELMGKKMGHTSSLYIDNQDSQLYRLHETKTIITTDMDFNVLRTHVPRAEELQSIAVGRNFLYWINNQRIQRCKKYDCSRTETLKEFNWNGTVFQMSLFHREGQLQDRMNHCAGGLCSHICLLTPKYFRCICPSGMHLMEDSRTCAEFENFRNRTKDAVSSYKPIIFTNEDDNGGRFGFLGSLKQWICANGMLVDLADLCNGTLGCPDGTDEGRYCDISCSKINLTDNGKDCLRTPNGPQIACPQGFLPAADQATCQDVNECLETTTCDNQCFNTNGGFECRDLPSDSLGVTLAAAIPTIVTIVVIGIAIFFGVKYIQTRKILRKLTPEEVLEFLDGDENAANIADCGADKAMLMPFRLVIQPENINIAKDAILGSGQFGVVYRGFYDAEAVAIKTFKRTVEIDEFKAVLAEAKIMAYIGDHVNVVKFIGADVSRIADRKLALVTELSPHGDLLGHLRKMEPSKWAQQSNETTQSTVTPTDLVEWCEQIACGMQYLEEVKIVHGDLAARNVLVFKNNVVKITDFGLSKQLYGNSEYLLKRQRMLPWKWSALELLTRREFSTDSDIWAFGVTAWEIFSLGRQPYDQLAIGMEFVQYLEQGHRLPKPTYATSGIYEILKGCWDVDRASRPRFASLMEFFREETTKTGMNNHIENLMASGVDFGYTKV